MFETADQAKTYILAHDDTARVLNRKPRYELAAIERSELAAHGMTRIIGQLSKDELINSILEMRFPDVDQARAVYYRAEADRLEFQHRLNQARI